MTTTSDAARMAVLGRGARDSLAVAVAYLPFGLTLGAALGSSQLPPLIAWSTSPLLFGGAAQLVSVQLLDAGTGMVVVALGALVVNARMLLYSAALAPHAAAWPARWRWAGAYLLADPVYALAAGRFEREDGGGSARDRLRYYLGVGCALWVAWQAMTGAGMLLAGMLPRSLHLEAAAPLTFLLLLLPMLTSRAACAAAATGALVAVAASGLPLGLGLLPGAAAGIAAGCLVRGRRG
jgi:predicted branched-subunit amino acid permease